MLSALVVRTGTIINECWSFASTVLRLLEWAKNNKNQETTFVCTSKICETHDASTSTVELLEGAYNCVPSPFNYTSYT